MRVPERWIAARIRGSSVMFATSLYRLVACVSVEKLFCREHQVGSGGFRVADVRAVARPSSGAWPGGTRPGGRRLGGTRLGQGNAAAHVGFQTWRLISAIIIRTLKQSQHIVAGLWAKLRNGSAT